MNRYWVVRLGEGGKYVEEARIGNYVAIGWRELGDLTWLIDKNKTQEDLKESYREKYKEDSEAQVAIGHGQVWNFVRVMDIGDVVLVPHSRRVLIGKITGNYTYKANWGDRCDYSHRRTVEWIKEIEKHDLSQNLKGSLGAWQTVFNLDKYTQEINYLTTGVKEVKEKREATGDELVNAVKEKLFNLSPKEFEEFITHLLSLIGFEAATTRYVADKGVDVIGTLNSDGLANLILRIQVKRVKGNIGASEVRDIRGTLAQGEHGAIVTLSGFTSQAQEEANSPNKIPIALIDGDSLVDLILKYYDNLDGKYKTPLALRKRDVSLKDSFFVTFEK